MRKLSVLAAAAALTASSLFADVQIGKGLSVSGFVDMAYENVSETNAGVDTDSSGFMYNTAEIDFMMDFGGGLSAQFDLEGNAGGDDGSSNDGDIELEQAKIMYSTGEHTFTFGKQDAFIGLEGLEAPDLYQYSNSLTWDEQFTQQEGIAYGYDNGTFNLAVGIYNSLGSDEGNDGGDGEELSYAFHVGWTPSDAVSVNFNYAIENDTTPAVAAVAAVPSDVTTLPITLGSAAVAAVPEMDNGYDYMSADVSYSNHGWTVGAEYVTKDYDVDSETTAYMVMANYMFNEQFGLTARMSVAEDEDADGDTTRDASEFTLSASYAITPNWFALVEYRTDEDDEADTETDTIAVEALLTF